MVRWAAFGVRRTESAGRAPARSATACRAVRGRCARARSCALRGACECGSPPAPCAADTPAKTEEREGNAKRTEPVRLKESGRDLKADCCARAIPRAIGVRRDHAK